MEIIDKTGDQLQIERTMVLKEIGKWAGTSVHQPRAVQKLHLIPLQWRPEQLSKQRLPDDQRHDKQRATGKPVDAFGRAG